MPFPEKKFSTNAKLKEERCLTICSYHVTYACQSESTLYICVNVKELLTRNKRDM